MKTLIITLALLLSVTTAAEAKKYSSKPFGGTGSNSRSHNVNGYTKRNGTYVAPHHSTNPNQTQRDNYNTDRNYNPHNGQYGKQYVDR